MRGKAVQFGLPEDSVAHHTVSAQRGETHWFDDEPSGEAAQLR